MNFRLTEWVWRRSPITIPNDRLLLLAIATEADQDGFSRVGVVTLAARVRQQIKAVRKGLLRLVEADAVWIARFNEFRLGHLERAPFELTIGIKTLGSKCGPRIPESERVDSSVSPPRQAQHLTLAPPLANAADATRAISKSVSRLLQILAERPEGLTRKNLAIRAGVNENSGFFEGRMLELRDRGWVAILGPNNQIRQITELGLATLGSYTPTPSTDAVLKHWIGALKEGPSRMLAKLAAVHPSGMTTAQLGKELHRLPESPGFVLDMAELRRKALAIEHDGLWTASEELFR